MEDICIRKNSIHNPQVIKSSRSGRKLAKVYDSKLILKSSENLQHIALSPQRISKTLKIRYNRSKVQKPIKIPNDELKPLFSLVGKNKNIFALDLVE